MLKEVRMNHEIISNELDEKSQVLIEKVEEITYKRAKKSNSIGKKDNLANLERKIRTYFR